MALKTDAITSGVKSSNSLTLEMLDRTAKQQGTLDRLEALSDSIADISIGSMRSLASMRSMMSTNGRRLSNVSST